MKNEYINIIIENESQYNEIISLLNNLFKNYVRDWFTYPFVLQISKPIIVGNHIIGGNITDSYFNSEYLKKSSKVYSFLDFIFNFDKYINKSI